MAGDYTRQWAIYGGSVVDVLLPTILPLILSKGTNRQITVQRIVFTPSVWTGTTISFLDSLTGIEIGHFDIPATNPTLAGDTNMFYIDFGATGVKISAGANLILGGNAAGQLHIEAYQKGTIVTIAPYVAPRTAGFTA